MNWIIARFRLNRAINAIKSGFRYIGHVTQMLTMRCRSILAFPLQSPPPSRCARAHKKVTFCQSWLWPWVEVYVCDSVLIIMGAGIGKLCWSCRRWYKRFIGFSMWSFDLKAISIAYSFPQRSDNKLAEPMLSLALNWRTRILVST